MVQKRSYFLVQIFIASHVVQYVSFDNHKVEASDWLFINVIHHYLFILWSLGLFERCEQLGYGKGPLKGRHNSYLKS